GPGLLPVRSPAAAPPAAGRAPLLPPRSPELTGSPAAPPAPGRRKAAGWRIRTELRVEGRVPAKRGVWRDRTSRPSPVPQLSTISPQPVQAAARPETHARRAGPGTGET